ncbi:hypothetical protein [Microbulbifer halophilus]|uniref:hypothetical protein n=1 Tax=Microbulbifer halophilus TaxID=453963 RepID=UPI0036094138
MYNQFLVAWRRRQSTVRRNILRHFSQWGGDGKLGPGDQCRSAAFTWKTPSVPFHGW